MLTWTCFHSSNSIPRERENSAQGLWRPRLGIETSLLLHSIDQSKLQGHPGPKSWEIDFTS